MSNLEHVRRYQSNNIAKGLCKLCPKPLKAPYPLCEAHHAAQVEYTRRRQCSKPWVPGGAGRIPKGYAGPFPEKNKPIKQRSIKSKPKIYDEPVKAKDLPASILALAAEASGAIQRIKSAA